MLQDEIVKLALFKKTKKPNNFCFCVSSSAARETGESYVLVEKHKRSHLQMGSWGSRGDLH